MTKLKLQHVFQIFIAFGIVGTSACSSLPLFNSGSSSQLEAVGSAYEQKQAQLFKQFQKKPPYTGPVKLAIHTNLLNPQKPGKHLDLTAKFNSQNFQIQSLPQGPLIFQETFTKGKGAYEVIRGFRVPDTNQRYTLHVEQVGKNNSGHQITVNINGTDYFKQESVKGKEAEINTLLLNANNSLRVRLQGKEGSSFIVSIVQGGEAGTLLRRQGRLGQPGENQATRFRRNDTNIFDPSDPDSLGGLMPYEGQLDEEGVPPGVTGVAVDGTSPLQFEAGTLILRLRNPEIILPILQAKYGATVINRVEIPGYPDFVYYYLQFDLSKSPIDQAASLIQTYRQKIPADFKDFVFASPSGFQTFVLLMDLLVNYEEYIATWELNGFSKAPLEPLLPVETNDWKSQDRNPALANNRGWWLRDTFIQEAWNLSLGTGVNVAYIDNGFKGILNGNTPHAEFGERLKVDPLAYGTQNILAARRASKVRINSTNVMECNDLIIIGETPTDHCNRNHGSNTAMVGFAQRNNNLGTVGSAPNANLIPYNTDLYVYTYALSLLSIVQSTQHIDVIGYNKQDQAPIGWVPVSNSTDLGNDPISWHLLRVVLGYITGEKKIPVIVAAGNDGSRCPSRSFDPTKKCNKEFIPSSYQGYPSPLNPQDPSKKINLIIAGGAQRDHSKPTPIHPAGDHKPNSTGSIVSWGVPGSSIDKGSSIGLDYIWTPAADIEHLDFGAPTDTTPPRINKFNGTSLSCPILTGVVALMKSRNPNLTIQEIKDILASSPTRIDIVHEAPVISNQPFVDAQDAVEKAIDKRPAGSNNPADYKAKDFFAFVQADPTAPNGKVLRFNKYVQPNTGIKDQQRLPLRSVADNTWNGPLAPGKLTHIKGWADITAGEVILRNNLEILDATEICAVPASGVCSSSTTAFDPKLTSGQATEDSASASYHITLKGENLIADLRNGIAKPVTLAFSGTATSGTPVNKEMAFASADILSINNDGKEVKVRLLKNRLSDGIEAPPSEKLPKGNYKIAFKNTITNKPSNLVGNGSSDFGIKAESGGFSFDNISTTPPANGPGNVSVWLTRDGRGLQVNSSQLLGIGITNKDLTGLQISIDNKLMPIRSFAQDYVTFGIPANLSPGVKNVLLTLAGNSITLEEAIEVLALPPLQEVQSLTTHAALGSASFAIDNQRYLAFANYYNGASHSITSDIYRWQNGQFMPFQALPSLGAYDVEPFQIGNDAYLALINNYDGASGNHLLDSQIHKWNGTQFELLQSLTTEGATDAEHFVINGEHYLAVTHFWNRGPDLTSVIYKWNGSQFVHYQSIPTTGGFRWKAFQIGNESFLALASYAAYYGGNANTTSHIFKWNGAQFVNFQAIPTVNAYDWEAFSIGNQHFLAVANFGTNIANQTGTSVIYRWSGSQFEPFQNITTSKATDWEYFEVNGVPHLIVASYEQASRIYRWEGSDFQLYRTLLSDGNIHWEFLSVGDQEYLLAVSNYYGSEGYNTPSKVYKFD